MTESRPRVFSIPPSVRFLDTLAQAMRAGAILPDWPKGDDPLALSEATIFLPTRRAARGLAQALSDFAGTETVLLPKIVALGGIEDAEERLIFEQGLAAFAEGADILPEIDPVRRRLILTQLILAWSRQIDHTLREGLADHPVSGALAAGILRDPGGFVVASSPRDGLQLADALGQLIDTLVIHNKTWEEIHALVPDDLADKYWSISKDFLTIAAETWPLYCKASGVMDAAARRHALIVAEAVRLKQERPTVPMIAAGSTGSMPATAKLLAAIAHLPRGAVILPGLDKGLDGASWQSLTGPKGEMREPGHPQAQLCRLLREIGVEREDVVSFGEAAPALAARVTFLSETMRPVETTDLWQSRAERLSDEDVGAALAGISVVEAAHEREEALAIAIAMRGALEVPDKTAALITPDRALAERVSNELKRWNIDVEDSAGIALARTEAGRLALLLIEAVASRFSPHAVLALLSHPLARFGLDPACLLKARTALDIAVLRRPMAGTGLAGLRAACTKTAKDAFSRRMALPRQRIKDEHWTSVFRLLDQWDRIIGELLDGPQGPLDLISLLARHEAATRAAAAKHDQPDALDEAEGAGALTALFEAAGAGGDGAIIAQLADYPAFFEALTQGIMVPRATGSHRRLKIWGLLEARLMASDLVILAGLDENVWPPDPTTDPFLSRPWRDQLDLPAPERRIGQTAHDLVEAMGAGEVIVTRAAKRSGRPMVASRFLQRMKAVAGPQLFAPVLMRGEALLDWARRLDEVPLAAPLAQPRPVPPHHLLPNTLSVTEIETLRRDPYSIYAKHVLKLDALDPIGQEIGARERGSAIHEALKQFCLDYPAQLPPDAFAQLCSRGRAAFGDIAHEPSFNTFWWPRFEAMARWFVGWEETRRPQLADFKVEQYGKLTVPLAGGGTFTLTGQADRLETKLNGSFSVIDYKTGTVPTTAQVRVGFSPQLTLEAAMVKRGAFAAIVSQHVDELLYIKLGGREGGEEKHIRSTTKNDPFDPNSLADAQFEQLKALIDDHWNHGRPFASRPYPQFLKAYAHYDHLARVKEWSLTGGTDMSDEGGGEA